MSSHVDFIHIGYHRCASTTLQADVFGNHPNVIATKDSRLALGEVSDFAQCKWPGRCRPNDPTVKMIGVSSEALCGVDYINANASSAWCELSERIHQAWPTTKILIVIRRQPDLIRSYYSLALRKYCFTAPAKAYYQHVFQRELLQFDRVVKRYMDLFGRARVKVLPMEMLSREPEAFLNELSNFLQIEFPAHEQPRRNIGRNDASNEVLRWINMGLRALGRERGLAREKKLLRAVLDRVTPDRKLFYAPGDRDAIRKEFHASNVRTSELIGIDLVRRYNY